MKKKIGLVLAAFLAVAMSACMPSKDNTQPIPGPNPDHGPNMSLHDCQPPFLVISVMITGSDSPTYAVRQMHLTVSGVDPVTNQPVTFEDKKTGKQTQFTWSPEGDPVTTDAFAPYLACVEYEEFMALALDVNLLIVHGQPLDIVRLKVSSYGDGDGGPNLCHPAPGSVATSDLSHAEFIIPEKSKAAVINCVVPA